MDDAAFKRRIGSVLSGKWRLDALLGTGGMASVFAATHVRNRLQTAVKVLHPEVSRDEKLRQRFLREGYVANSVKHPGVVQVFDDSGDEPEAYLVMELLTGQTLKQRWNGAGRKLPLEEVRTFVSAILDVLVAAHAADVVHRDLKPDNVFLTETGVLKLLDFGIARLREVQNAHEHQTNTGVLLGTPAFMPPEQALGNWEEVDARADLFAVAATAWVLLTGQLVHQAKGVSELLIAAATRTARPIQSLVENLPDPVARVIDQGLAFDKANRFPDAQSMKQAWDASFMVARSRAPTLRMLPPPSQSLVDWSVRGGPPPPSSQSAPPSGTGPPTLSDDTPLGPTPVRPSFDPHAGVTPPASKVPSIPSRLFTTETPVSRESFARGSSKRPLWIALALAGAAITALVVVVVAMSGSSARTTTTPSGGPTASDSGTRAPDPAPTASTVIVPRPTAEATVTAVDPTVSAAPSSSTVPSASPSAKLPPRAPPITTRPALPAGCEDPMRDFANNGQPCPRRK